MNVGVAGRRRGRRPTGRTLCQTRSPSFDAACELSISMSKEWRLQVCDAPRCPELHARYTAEAQQGGPGLAASAACPGTCPNSKVPLGNLEDSLKQGLSPVQQHSPTRNALYAWVTILHRIGPCYLYTPPVVASVRSATETVRGFRPRTQPMCFGYRKQKS